MPGKDQFVIQVDREFSGPGIFPEFYNQIPSCLLNRAGQTGRYRVLASGGAKLYFHLHGRTPFSSVWVLPVTHRRLFAAAMGRG